MIGSLSTREPRRDSSLRKPTPFAGSEWGGKNRLAPLGMTGCLAGGMGQKTVGGGGVSGFYHLTSRGSSGSIQGRERVRIFWEA